MKIETIRVSRRSELEEAWRIRFEVFVAEQQVPPELELDSRDEEPGTIHALTFLVGSPVATGRVLPDAEEGHVHVGRVAVRAHSRGSGVGAAVMAFLEGQALAEYGRTDAAGQLSVTVALSAQESAMGFYERLGYKVVSGERYLDAGIWHQDMERIISL